MRRCPCQGTPKVVTGPTPRVLGAPPSQGRRQRPCRGPLTVVLGPTPRVFGPPPSEPYDGALARGHRRGAFKGLPEAAVV